MGVGNLRRNERQDDPDTTDRSGYADVDREGRRVRQAGGGGGAGDAGGVQRLAVIMHLRHGLGTQQQQRGDERQVARETSLVCGGDHPGRGAYRVAAVPAIVPGIAEP